MANKSRLQILFAAMLLIGLGWRAIETDVILPYRGKGWVLVPSFPVNEPYVPYVGGLLILAGIYVLYRLVKTLKKK